MISRRFVRNKLKQLGTDLRLFNIQYMLNYAVACFIHLLIQFAFRL